MTSAARRFLFFCSTARSLVTRRALCARGIAPCAEPEPRFLHRHPLCFDVHIPHNTPDAARPQRAPTHHHRVPPAADPAPTLLSVSLPLIFLNHATTAQPARSKPPGAILAPAPPSDIPRDNRTPHTHPPGLREQQRARSETERWRRPVSALPDVAGRQRARFARATCGNECGAHYCLAACSTLLQIVGVPQHRGPAQGTTRTHTFHPLPTRPLRCQWRPLCHCARPSPA